MLRLVTPLVEPLERRSLFSVPTLSASKVSVTEGTDDFAFVTVRLSAASTRSTKISYATKSGTAVSGVDFTAGRGTLTIPAGERSGVIAIPMLDNALLNATAKFHVVIRSAVHAKLPPGSFGTVTVHPDATVSEAPYNLSDNLYVTTGGAQQAIGGNYFAASFYTAPARILTSITLPLGEVQAGSPTVSIYADTGTGHYNFGLPGDLVGTLVSPASYTGGLSLTTFTTPGIHLQAHQGYWVVLNPNGGVYNWGHEALTRVEEGTGAGFTGGWVYSTDGGLTWRGRDDTNVLQMRVTTIE